GASRQGAAAHRRDDGGWAHHHGESPRHPVRGHARMTASRPHRRMRAWATTLRGAPRRPPLAAPLSVVGTEGRMGFPRPSTMRQAEDSAMRGIEGEQVLVRIYLGESKTVHRHPLHRRLLELLRQEGLAGATVLKGCVGYRQ